MHLDTRIGRFFSPLVGWLTSRAESRPGKIAYRPDIDGLRAVAVLAVLGYHLGFRPLGGGFVGVDVFFVVSGFLIGSLVFAEVEAKQFSFARFYVRRIRRLFPALFVMLAAVGVLSALVLYPANYLDFGKSLAAAVTSTSNIYFWLTSDYFDTSSITAPLLHTWSLSVEEQFYLLFPPLALAIAHFAPGRARLVILVIGLGSFAISVASTYLAPEAAFYLLHNRAWELALGIYLARTQPLALGPIWRTLVAAVGLLLIAATILLADGERLGLAPVPACIGAAMLIVAGRAGRNWISDLLSWRPVVFVGLISYSLYLWHWPLIVLYQYRLGMSFLELPDKILVAAAAFFVSILSWYFVERPFRRGSSPAPVVFSTAGASAFAITAAALAIVTMQGVPSRFEPGVVRLASYLQYEEGADSTKAAICLLDSSRETLRDFLRAHCLDQSQARPDILLVGDSHAAGLRDGLEAILPWANIMQATATQCRPVLDSQFRDARECRRLMDMLYREYLPQNQVDLVVLSGRWTDDDIDDLRETLLWLRQQDIPVVLVGPFAQYHGAVPQLVALARQYHDANLPDRHLRDNIREVDLRLRALARDLNVPYGSAYDVLCPEGDCRQLNRVGIPLQHDYGHLTREGSIYVVRRLDRLGVFSIAENDASPTSLYRR